MLNFGGVSSFLGDMFFLFATSKAVSAASLLHARRASSKKVAIARRAEEKGSVQQLLGMKGAGETDDTPLWKNLGPIRWQYFFLDRYFAFFRKEMTFK